MAVKQLRVAELQKKINEKDDVFLLDVRETHEFKYAKIDGSVLIPLNELPQRLTEIDHTKPVIVICHHGMRSLQAANFLDRVGFPDIHNLIGGIDAWSLECDASVPRY